MASIRPLLVGGLLALLVPALGGCDVIPSATPVHLGVSNGTALTVTLVVNGTKIADFPANNPQPTVDPRTLPPLPWHVEARSPSGRILTSMDVGVGTVWTTSDPQGNAMSRGAMGRVDLSCGRLTIWAGDFEPSGPAPAASPGLPGDCVP